MAEAQPASPSQPLPYGGRLMFTQSWEDPECDLAALRPLPGETLLTVASGGDNTLGFLLANPARVIALDLNPTQIWLLELKMEAFRCLSHSDVLHFLGVRSTEGVRDIYRQLADRLSDGARLFWDGHLEWLDRGVLVSGGFERYFALLRGGLRLVVGRRRMEALFAQDAGSQGGFFEREWNTLRWRALVRVLCSRRVLGSRLDPSWFQDAETPSFGAHFQRLATHVLAELPARNNYFLAQILLGRYLDEQQVPPYLQAGNFEVIRSRLDRIETMVSDVGEALATLPARSVDCFALSNVFEYSPVGLFRRSVEDVTRVARPGARCALRNLLAPRRLADYPGFLVDHDESTRLRWADRGFIYSHFEAARVREEA